MFGWMVWAEGEAMGMRELRFIGHFSARSIPVTPFTEPADSCRLHRLPYRRQIYVFYAELTNFVLISKNKKNKAGVGFAFLLRASEWPNQVLPLLSVLRHFQ